MRGPVLRLNQSPIIDDHRERARNLPCDRKRKIEAPPGDKRNFDAFLYGGLNRVPVNRRHLGGAIEQRPVDIERNQAHAHWSIPLQGISLFYMRQAPAAASTQNMFPVCTLKLLAAPWSHSAVPVNSS